MSLAQARFFFQKKRPYMTRAASIGLQRASLCLILQLFRSTDGSGGVAGGAAGVGGVVHRPLSPLVAAVVES